MGTIKLRKTYKQVWCEKEEIKFIGNWVENTTGEKVTVVRDLTDKNRIGFIFSRDIDPSKFSFPCGWSEYFETWQTLFTKISED